MISIVALKSLLNRSIKIRQLEKRSSRIESLGLAKLVLSESLALQIWIPSFRDLL